MTECLDDKLLEEKKSLIDFLKNHKELRRDVESSGKNYETFLTTFTGMSVVKIYDKIYDYAELETQSKLLIIIQKKYPNMYAVYSKEMKDFDFSGMIPPKDWDSHDSDPDHF